MSNRSILEKFLEEITNEIPTDDRIVLNTSKIEIGTKRCILDRFVRKKIILSWVESKEDKQTDVSVNPYDMKYIRCRK